MNVRNALILISFFGFTGCEQGFNWEIQNKSGLPVTIEIQFNKATLNKSWQHSSYIKYLQDFGSGCDKLNLDTINLIGTYKVLPDSTFHLQAALGARPPFDIFQRLRIIKKDTIEYDKDQIENLFSEVDNFNWVMKIK